MLTEILKELYERDLDKLRAEIEQFTNEADLWKVDGGVTNSAGNLCQHLTGNLKHFVGAVLGGSGYVRDRDAEFANRQATKTELLSDIDATKGVVLKTLAGLAAQDIERDYPLDVFGHKMTTGYFIAHLATHFNYHLGQINYLRRLTAAK
jgi:uncharacterized damage-inducible protein DinB